MHRAFAESEAFTMKHRAGSDRRRASHQRRAADQRRGDESIDVMGSLRRTPGERAEDTLGYQKLAWYAAPFGSEGVAVLVLAAAMNLLRAMALATIRLLRSVARVVSGRLGK